MTVMIGIALSSCTQQGNPNSSAYTEDKSEKYVETWTKKISEQYTKTLIIKKIEGKFFLYPQNILGGGGNDNNGKTLSADYDAVNDKLLLFGGRTEIVYYPPNQTLLVSNEELTRETVQ